jgi:hypothetical protein
MPRDLKLEKLASCPKPRPNHIFKLSIYCVTYTILELSGSECFRKKSLFLPGKFALLPNLTLAQRVGAIC